MADNNTEFETGIGRWSVLATVGTAVGAGLAGCGGGGGAEDDDGDDSDEGTDSGGETEQPSERDIDGPTAGGDDCPSMPSSYSREEIPAMLSDDPVATIEVPASGPSIEPGSATLRVDYAIGSVVVQSRRRSETAVEDELMAGLPAVTDEYDLPSGARAQREEIAQSNRVDVYIPAGSDVVYVSVAASGPDNCLGGSLTAIRDQMVNTIEVL